MAHRHTWFLATHRERNAYDHDDDRFIYRSVWLCECGEWKSTTHTTESYWNNKQPVSKEDTPNE